VSDFSRVKVAREVEAAAEATIKLTGQGTPALAATDQNELIMT